MGEIISFLLDNWPYAIWLIIGGIIVGFYFNIKNKIDNMTKDVNNLPCEKHTKKIDDQKENHRELDVKIEKINISMDYSNKTITDISKSLSLIAEKMKIPIIHATPLTQTMSPLSLSDRGKEKVKELRIDKMIDSRWSEISDLIGGLSESKNPYDLQQVIIEESMLFPEKFLHKEDIEKLKKDAYSNGDILQSYMRVIAVIVRDRYFEEHNIDVSQIDIFEPGE
jgi:hypothetical protein